MLSPETIDTIRRAGNMFKGIAQLGAALDDWLNQKAYLEEMKSGLESQTKELDETKKLFEQEGQKLLAAVEQEKRAAATSVKKAQAELESLGKNKAALQKEVDAMETSRDQAQAEFDKAQDELRQKLAAWEYQIGEAEKTYDAVQAKIKALKDSL